METNPATYEDLLKEIATRTSNDVIIFSIVLIVGLSIVLLPILAYINKSRKESHENNLKEKELIIGVIDRNTSAFCDLKNTLEANNVALMTSLNNIEKHTLDGQVNITKMLIKQDNSMEKLDRIIESSEDTADSTNKHMEQITTTLNKVLDKKTPTPTHSHKTTKPKKTLDSND